MTSQPTKRCTKCHERKHAERFSRNRHTGDGRNYWCKPCASLANKARNEKCVSSAASPAAGLGDDPGVAEMPASFRSLFWKGMAMEITAAVVRHARIGGRP